MSERYHNYDFHTDFAGHSVVTHNDRGIIVETALPFRKWIGEHIDDMVSHYAKRDSFRDMKELGTTKDGVLQSQITTVI